MPTTIKLKNSVTTTNAPSSLVQGEVAINITDKKVWIGDAATTPIQLLGAGASASFSALTVTSLSDSGNLTFTGTGNRITGDFSNATLANRVVFQSSTTNGQTGIVAIPNGTSTNAQFEVNSDSSGGTNGSIAQLALVGGTEVRLVSGSRGTGTNLPLTMFTGGSERLRIDTSGNVGIGTTSISRRLTVSGKAQFTSTSNSNELYLADTDSSVIDNQYIGSVGNNIRIGTGGSERMRIDSSGNVGIGTSSPVYPLQVSRTTVGGAVWINANNTDTTSGSTAGFFASNGSVNAVIYSSSNGGVGTYGMTTNHPMTFITNNTERMRITSGGDVLVAKTTNALGTAGISLFNVGAIDCTRSGGQGLAVNRLTNDGILVEFYQDTTLEGNISVSGTTVSYNGGHLSRYAQTVGAKDESLLKGTVLSNLDEMNVYVDDDGNSVDNEQLNKVKVSDVEGDVNVAGVFVNWEHDKHHNVDEINMAMTGDMIIRIAQGVVVQKGDLLMSAGDGTAKPQGDDIVRSKTIAKVTSNHVTCTYADGSYCVPCVLMAC